MEKNSTSHAAYKNFQELRTQKCVRIMFRQGYAKPKIVKNCVLRNALELRLDKATPNLKLSRIAFRQGG